MTDSVASVTAAAAARSSEGVEHERGREDGGHGIRTAAAGDVGSRAVDGLEQAGAAVGQGGRRGQPDAAGDRSGEVGEDVAEQVLGDHDVELRGTLDQAHGHGVDQLVLELDLGVLGATSSATARHRARGLEDVGLVDAGHAAAPPARRAGRPAARRAGSRRAV